MSLNADEEHESQGFSPDELRDHYLKQLATEVEEIGYHSIRLSVHLKAALSYIRELLD